MNAAEGTWVYMLRGDSGRYYIGMTDNLDARVAQHRNGHTYTTRRLGGNLTVAASFCFSTRAEAHAVEIRLKSWKNSAKALAFLNGLSS